MLSTIHHTKKYHMKNRNESGFVILFAIIISAIIMLIGAGIFSIALKETILSSTVAESSIGIFAADTGMECALYHEYIEKSRGWNLDDDITFDCGLDIGITEKPIFNSSVVGEYQFKFAIDGTPSCGEVIVLRDRNRLGELRDTEHPEAGTLIISRGFNVCLELSSGDSVPDKSNQFLIERRLEAWYPNQAVLDADGDPVDIEGDDSTTDINPNDE